MTEVRLATPADTSLFERVAPEVFDAPVRPPLLREFLADPRHHIAVAIDDGGTLVGFASAVHYLHPDKPTELFVNEVGVSPAHRGKGLGRRLMACLLDHGRSLGCRGAWVLTERGNTAANRLYASAGGDAAGGEFVMYEFDLSEL